MKAFTDVPIVELGDTVGYEAPIREVQVLSFDGDKYFTVQVKGITVKIVAGRIYRNAARYGHGQAIDSREWCTTI